MRIIIAIVIAMVGLYSHSQSTASKNIETFKLVSKQLDTTKTIWVYLPVSYKTDSITYPVIYMFDAQNLFDRQSSFAGEWGIDEYLDSKKTNAIIVGVEHGNEKRIDELTPFANQKYGGGKADDMLKFVIETLKPEIDRKYRTKTQPLYTTIAGSSLGGLSAFYAALKFPNTFGNAGVFSPSFWINPEIYDEVKNLDVSNKTRFYFTAGTNEGESMVPDLERMLSTLTDNGVSLKKIEIDIVPDGTHNEEFWGSQFPHFMEWLMSYSPNKLLYTN